MANKPESILLVIDVQNDFITGGNLAIHDSHTIIPLVNQISQRFNNVILTQDWHPPGHLSFASSHANYGVYDTISLAYGPQTLWPDHCVQGARGAAFHDDLHIPHSQLVIRKGYQPEVDSYSAFFAADRTTSTGLAGYLRDRGLQKLVLAGLATDFCVAWSALDARRLGFEVTVLEDACRGIDLDGSLESAWRDMIAAGVTRTHSMAMDY